MARGRLRRDPAKIRRAIVTAAAIKCSYLLRPYEKIRFHEHQAVWRVITDMLVAEDTGTHPIDIYEFCFRLDYYAYECTTSYMDIMTLLRRSITSEWVAAQRIKLYQPKT